MATKSGDAMRCVLHWRAAVVLASLAGNRNQSVKRQRCEGRVQELCTQFERATGNKINLHFEVNADIEED
jgi:hypothetical protein